MKFDVREPLVSVGANGQNFQNDVRVVQTELKRPGFYSGAVNGHCDILTTYAIREYQSNFMFVPDGLITMRSETWDYLSNPLRKLPCGAYDPSVVVPVPFEEDATKKKLEGYLGKHIKDICPIGYVGINNCAHFVAHAMGIRIGLLCDEKLVSHKKSNSLAVSIRVNEIFNSLDDRGLWNSKPSHVDGTLVFVTPKNNVNNNEMTDHPKKHIGILHGGKVYNYTNSASKVIADISPDDFLKKFKQKNVYGSDTELYYGIY